MIDAPEILVAGSRERVGVSDLGPDGWQEGLERLVAAVASDIGDADAAARIEAIIVGRLATRLRVEAWYAAHASEAAPPVEQPLIIVGLPRTGTTAIHHLLALDPRFRFLRTWEANDPVPPDEPVDDARIPAAPGRRHRPTCATSPRWTAQRRTGRSSRSTSGWRS